MKLKFPPKFQSFLKAATRFHWVCWQKRRILSCTAHWLPRNMQIVLQWLQTLRSSHYPRLQAKYRRLWVSLWSVRPPLALCKQDKVLLGPISLKLRKAKPSCANILSVYTSSISRKTWVTHLKVAWPQSRHRRRSIRSLLIRRTSSNRLHIWW